LVADASTPEVATSVVADTETVLVGTTMPFAELIPPFLPTFCLLPGAEVCLVLLLLLPLGPPDDTCSKGPVSEEIAARGEDFVGSEWTFALLLRASSNAGQETAPITELIAETFDALPLGFFHAGLEDFTTSSVAAILLLRGGAGSEVAVPSLCSSLSATTSVCFTPSISWPGTFDA